MLCKCMAIPIRLVQKKTEIDLKPTPEEIRLQVPPPDITSDCNPFYHFSIDRQSLAALYIGLVSQVVMMCILVLIIEVRCGSERIDRDSLKLGIVTLQFVSERIMYVQDNCEGIISTALMMFLVLSYAGIMFQLRCTRQEYYVALEQPPYGSLLFNLALLGSWLGLILVLVFDHVDSFRMHITGVVLLFGTLVFAHVGTSALQVKALLQYQKRGNAVTNHTHLIEPFKLRWTEFYVVLTVVALVTSIIFGILIVVSVQGAIMTEYIILLVILFLVMLNWFELSLFYNGWLNIMTEKNNNDDARSHLQGYELTDSPVNVSGSR